MKKACKMSTYSELERVLSSQYDQVRASNILVDGNILPEKAREIAASNGTDTFSAPNGWLSRFKIRYGDDVMQMKSDCI
ncbi:hypothetical protein NPIL_329021 [Nephila pilipes]|uniref:HTH CENPB-type domain-containing protein n=1 Tax=Nephila pilipes TaxID=299642 RepID=A0A8X6Q7V4_NEPPI|nr:hypothetical protein NPIL_329021 [Nephila pilipes]